MSSRGMSTSFAALTRARMLAALLLFPLSAFAEDSHWELLGVYVVVVPTILLFFAGSSVLWFICSERVRPWAIAIWAIPLSPISAGDFLWWPLSMCLVGCQPSWGSYALSVIGTFLVANVIVRLLSREAWRWGAILALLRMLLFVALYTPGASTAMHGGGSPSPLHYWPLWVLDFPISIVYFVVPLSIPVYEAIVGPIWWLFVPTIVSKMFRHPTGRGLSQ